MSDAAFLRRVRIEPLGQKHDRAAFACGDERLDNFIRKTASRQQEQDIARTYVSCLDEAFVVIAYYALNSHFIDVTTLPEHDRRKLPAYETIPAIYLSKLGVHVDYQGLGLGSRLMAHAFKRCMAAADIIGAHFLVLDALNDDAARLYRRLGFVDLPGHEPRMIIKMSIIRTATRKPAES
jgi:ribosomal protein S18 acetylase RimI-like enzyme